jgi:ApaG protein
MNTITTEGVKITVDTQFSSDLSEVNQNQFFFNYHIEITNNNDYSVQLLHRDWYIFDSLNYPNKVSGEGVIGEQPILKPGQTFAYASGCCLTSEIGQMKGYYTFKNLINHDFFKVEIPSFQLEYRGKLN